MAFILELVILTLLVAFSSLFSASETSLISVSRSKVRLLLHKEKKGAIPLKKLKDSPHKTITTLLICNNLVNITASVIAANIALSLFTNNALAYATGIMTFILLVFGEIVPKSFAMSHSEKLSLKVAPVIYFLTVLLYPLVWLFDFITTQVFRLKPSQHKITEDEVRSLVDIAGEDGGIDKEEKELIHRIFRFDDTDVDAIKIPRNDMVTLTEEDTLNDVLNVLQKKPHSRFPVYDKGKKKVVGIFYFKDALKYIEGRRFDVKITSLMREPLFIPETKKIDETLRLLQKRKFHMAMIVDEHGGISGLVTLEDILEEIVGEIEDETEKVSPEIQAIDKHTYTVLGKTPLDKLNRKLKLNIKDKDYDTISGYILDKTGKIPVEGEEFEFEKLHVRVIKVEDNRIVELIVKIK